MKRLSWFFVSGLLCSFVLTACSSTYSDASLSDLSVELQGFDTSLTPGFSSAITNYTLWAGSASSLTVSATATSSKASVSFSKEQPMALSSGKNDLTVTVTAEDGSTQEYSLDIIRGNYLKITSPAEASTISSSTVTCTGYWYSSATPSIIVSFGGSDNATATVNSDNTWTATVDASSIPNGTKTMTARATYYQTTSTGSSNTYGTSNYNIVYNGSSSSLNTYSVTGTVTIPYAANLTSGQYCTIWLNKKNCIGTYMEKTFALTSATTYAYEVDGLTNGTYTVWAQTHNYNYTQTLNYYVDYYQSLEFSVSGANATFSLSLPLVNVSSNVTSKK